MAVICVTKKKNHYYTFELKNLTKEIIINGLNRDVYQTVPLFRNTEISGHEFDNAVL